MNKILSFIFIFVSTISFAQSKQSTEIKNFFWGEKDGFKSSNDIPEKWKNESAIIIYKNVNYDYHKFGKSITYTSSVRKRIKLLDKASVEEFSEFSLNKNFGRRRGYYGSWRNKGSINIGIKIIKPNGKQIEIDVEKDAIETDNEKKIAIASLEVGDIIDYYSHSVKSFKSRDAYGFNPVEKTLGETYPIMNLKLTFETENDFFVNFQSYNGAPDLKQINTKKKSLRRYELVATDLAKNDFPKWFFPLAELPSYKFQVFFARSGKFENRAIAFLPKKENIIKKKVTKEDVINLYDNKFKPNGDISDVKRYLKENNITKPRDIVIKGFYFMRHYYLTRYFEAAVMQEAEIVYYPFQYYGKDFIYISNQKDFINHYSEFLKKHKIDSEIIVATKRYNGPISDLLIEKDVDVLLKVKLKEPVYLTEFNQFTDVNEFSPLLESTDVYALELNDKKKITNIKKSTLKSSSHEDNNSTTTFNVSLDDNLEIATINKKTALTGHLKYSNQREALSLFDYVNEDHKKYKTKKFLDYIKKKRNKTKYTNELNALKTKATNKIKETVKNSTASEYTFPMENYEYNIEKTGRYGFSTPFVMNEKFTVEKGLIKKAGKNYIFQIGKFIGEQIGINDQEKQRTNNIYMSYPRSFNYSISFKIPKGYSIAGIDKLNTNVTNETGSFTSQAHIEGDELIIETYKSYIHNYEPNNNWPKMVRFLEAAYQFTQGKILLKKI